MARSALQNSAYIYVLQEREFLRSGEPVYKVGRSGALVKRMAQYPKGSVATAAFAVDAAVADVAESAVLTCCRRRFRARRDIGSEYFEAPAVAQLVAAVADIAMRFRPTDSPGELPDGPEGSDGSGELPDGPEGSDGSGELSDGPEGSDGSRQLADAPEGSDGSREPRGPEGSDGGSMELPDGSEGSDGPDELPDGPEGSDGRDEAVQPRDDAAAAAGPIAQTAPSEAGARPPPEDEDLLIIQFMTEHVPFGSIVPVAQLFRDITAYAAPRLRRGVVLKLSKVGAVLRRLGVREKLDPSGTLVYEHYMPSAAKHASAVDTGPGAAISAWIDQAVTVTHCTKDFVVMGELRQRYPMDPGPGRFFNRVAKARLIQLGASFSNTVERIRADPAGHSKPARGVFRGVIYKEAARP
jgi:hypothetical protein